jgi:hypothetical protein
MDDLFRQHPPPWAKDDNRPGNEGALCVYDAKGNIVVCLGDMEDVEGAELALADLIAAAPELWATCKGLLECFEHGEPWTKQAKAGATKTLRTALAQAGER